MSRYLTRTRNRIWTQPLAYAVVIFGAVLMIYPVIWMLSASFKPLDETFTSPSLIPQTWTLENYSEGWNALDYPFDVFFVNSFIVCIGAAIGNIISCSLAAYAFARINFKFKNFWFLIMLGTIMLPYHAIVVPQYILFKNLDWINTYLPLIVPKFLATDAFFIFLLVQFIRAIPRDLDDAAKIDGCNHFQMYARIILPLATPALATTAIFTFIWTWGDFFTQLIFLNDQSVYTVPVALRTFLDSTGISAYGQLFAVSIISLIPIIGFFIIFQRLLIEGTATSGIKG
ncbi:carbohydrate ABC transporter permease [Ktedonospora formicarum]|uniref:Sugar ABC transporter permease n=1 Tax=Ktedonospora formicarum TaxID=2778364 RepID=A0A8J3MX32_9CHLR|nr:carbohydrate ABC transporter permease [Ktedonospora formicarum]GHO51010.1 sugar ABC transporter permease [Ktedonospora formicarum]